MEVVTQSLDLLIFLTLVIVGYLTGSHVEKKHYKSIVARERELRELQTISAEVYFPEGKIKESFMVSGSVVISIDYFKRMLARLRNIYWWTS